MGTRHLTSVFLDGEYRVAQCGQWDGYPTGAGQELQELFRREDFDLEHLKARVRDCFFLNADALAMAQKKIDQYKSFAEAGYPMLSRDMGAAIVAAIYDSEGRVGLTDQLDFVGDSLMCEWAYVVDLDKGELQIFMGFNKTPLTPEDRFFDKTTIADHRETQYHPCKLITTIPFADVAAYDMSTVEPADEDAEEEEAEA